jgi:hypothetical protein
MCSRRLRRRIRGGVEENRVRGEEGGTVKMEKRQTTMQSI